MRSHSERERVHELASRGAGASAIARRLRVPRSTVRGWLAAGAAVHGDADACWRCAPTALAPATSSAYAYLLGLYLGDGRLSLHRRGVYKLRIFLDEAYPRIIDEATQAITAMPGRRCHRRTTDKHCVEVFSYWKHWPCLLPQHGPGKKHERPIVLAAWQRELVDPLPEPLLRGLIQSDGCRAINTGRGGWRHPRYAFSNRSSDIHGIFRGACDRVGVGWTAAPRTTYVSRVADVARLDAFIGPKA